MAKSSNVSAKFILRGQAIGFSTLLLLMWVLELFGVPELLFNAPAEFMWARLLTRSFILVGIWIIVHLTTRRLLRRLHELEGFLVICSWCRRVGHEGDWLSMENYFGSKFKTETSHGICPQCAAQQLAPAPAARCVTPSTPT